MIGRHFLPVGLLVERLRNKNKLVAPLSEIQCVCTVVLGEAESKQVLAVRQCRSKPQPFPMTVLIDELAKRSKHTSRRLDRISIELSPHHCQEHSLRVGRSGS